MKCPHPTHIREVANTPVLRGGQPASTPRASALVAAGLCPEAGPGLKASPWSLTTGLVTAWGASSKHRFLLQPPGSACRSLGLGAGEPAFSTSSQETLRYPRPKPENLEKKRSGWWGESAGCQGKQNKVGSWLCRLGNFGQEPWSLPALVPGL